MLDTGCLLLLDKVGCSGRFLLALSCVLLVVANSISDLRCGFLELLKVQCSLLVVMFEVFHSLKALKLTGRRWLVGLLHHLELQDSRSHSSTSVLGFDKRLLVEFLEVNVEC